MRLIIDAHIHCGSISPTRSIIDRLLRANADKAIIMAVTNEVIDGPEATEKANQYVLQAAVHHSHLIPFYTIGNELELPANLNAFKGVSWHQLPAEPDESILKKFLNKTVELNLPIIIEDSLETIQKIHTINDKVKLIIAHLGALEEQASERVMNAFRDVENVWFDTSLAPLSAIRWGVDNIGLERLVFGSDLPYGAIANEMDKINHLNLKYDQRQMIFSGNLLSLLGWHKKPEEIDTYDNLTPEEERGTTNF